MPPQKRRRILIETDFSDTSIASRKSIDTNVSNYQPNHIKICAKFCTTNNCGKTDIISLAFDRPASIGRNSSHCTYVIDDRVVSGVHCKLYAVQSSTGGAIISCQDLSTNGLLVNGARLHKSSAIVMDGDVIEIPQSQSFKCELILKEPKEKAHIFESTPPEKPLYKRIDVGKYQVVSHCLGSGSYASVHLANDVSACRQVACKTIILKAGERSNLPKIMKEAKILGQLSHPNINRIWDVITNEDNGWLHIFLELCTGGDLFTFITSHTKPPGYLCEGEAKYVMFQILKALKYLHDRMISHRDLKPENILLYLPGSYPRVQIADFGLARADAYQETLNVCGTVAYLPPEGVLALDRKDLGYIGMPADCWSVGVILYIMLSGSHPFDYHDNKSTELSSYIDESYTEASQPSRASQQVVKTRIVSGEVDFPNHVWEGIPKAKALVGRLLIYNHTFRETVYGALRSDWITSDLEELENAYKHRIGSE